MKNWRVAIWNRSRIFLLIRVSELGFLGIEKNKNWLYKVEPIQNGRKLLVRFKVDKK